MIVEYVGGPLCGQAKNVNALLSEFVEIHAPAPDQRWDVTYMRSGLRMGEGNRRFRYDFAGQRRVEPSSL